MHYLHMVERSHLEAVGDHEYRVYIEIDEGTVTLRVRAEELPADVDLSGVAAAYDGYLARLPRPATSPGYPRNCMSGIRTPRDRDESGRPHNARPRDALGRPLPQGSQGVPRVPDDLRLTPAETLDRAQNLLDEGLAFTAHEVFEAAWKNGPDHERPLWQALAQLAVGITHVQRGNRAGATALLRRASGRLTEVHRPAAHAIDVDGLIDYATALADVLQAGAEIRPTRLRPRLVSPSQAARLA